MEINNAILGLTETLSEQNILTSWKQSEEFTSSVCEYLSLLHKWNESHDLVAPGSIEDFILPHILDSLASVLVLSHAGLIPAFDSGSGFTFTDIGSGAGLPGIPWHIWYGDKATSYLVEPRRKRCSFLKTVTSELGLKNCHIIEGRSEALKSETSHVDAALFRALKPDREILKHLSAFQNISLYWLSGPNTVPEAPWKIVADYYLVSGKEHRRKILVSDG